MTTSITVERTMEVLIALANYNIKSIEQVCNTMHIQFAYPINRNYFLNLINQ
jgi:hypothetical protein